MNLLTRLKRLKEIKEPQKIIENTCAQNLPIFDPNFDVPGLQHKDYLQEYQWEGIQHLDFWDGNALLADDQGLGKTLQVLAWLQYRKEIRPTLVICPAIAKLTWLDEALFWMNSPKVQIISGREEVYIWGEIVVINYDILTRPINKKDVIRPDIWDIQWNCIILDEAHYISNDQTIRGWAVNQLIQDCPHVIPITATPARHRPKELFNLIRMVDERIFPNFKKYAHRYCDPKIGFNGVWQYEGASNEDELFDILTKTVMIRRKKQDVFKQLPNKIRYVIPFQIDNQEEYDAAESDFESLLCGKDYEGKSNHIFAKMEYLRQLAVKGKMSSVVEWLHNLLETEDKLVIFAEHSFTLDILQKEFGSTSVRIDGNNNNPGKREEARKAFQRCLRCGILKERHYYHPDACKSWIADLSCRQILASRSGITNITLTASNHVVFTELWPSSCDHDQGEDRVYGRAGDLHGATAWYLLAYGTIEMRQAAVYDLKNMNLTRVLDGKELSEKMMLTKLLESYRKEKS